MKKIIILIFIIFFITGCENNSDYTLEMSSDSIKETAFLTLKDNDYEKANYLNDVFSISTEHYNSEKESGTAIIDQLKTKDLQATDYSNELLKKTTTNNNLILTYDYNDDNYKNSKIFNNCFNNTYYDSTEEYYVIRGYEGFKCLYKDEIKIVIRTDYKIIDSNADEMKNKEYIWYFNEDNYLDHELYIQVSKQQKRTLTGNWKMYVLIIGIIIYIIYKSLTKENMMFIFKKNNEV